MSELQTQMISIKGPAHDIKVYLSRPAGPGTHPGLVLIHEIWGLLPHIRDVADRYAREGFVVAAPDLMGSDPNLAPFFTQDNIEAVMQFMRSLPPGKMRDQAYTQQEMAKLPEEKRATVGKFFAVAFGGALPHGRFAEELVAVTERLRKLEHVKPGRIGSLGFCFGGGMSARLACTGTTQACVVFYGANPDPIEQVEKINCPVLGLYGGEDAGLNASLDKLVAAMVKYKKDFEMKIYPGAPHAFFNDTNTYSYREAAAKDAWTRSVGFLNRCLKQG
jgi:carboxymethylenebutenolidase